MNNENKTVKDNGSVKLSKKQLIRLQQKRAKNKKIITSVVTSVIIVLIAVAIVWVSIPKLPNLEKDTAGKSEEYKIDNAMFGYLLYNNLQQYSSYLSYYGYDTSLSLKDNKGTCALDSSKSWYEYFRDMTEKQFDEYVAFATAAKKAGMTLTDEEKKEINDYMKEIEQTAYKQGYGTAKKYLADVYTPGVTLGAIKRVIEIETLAQKYYNDFIEKLEITEEEYIKYFDENPGSFWMTDYVSYEFKSTYKTDAKDDEKKAAYEEAKKKAEEFLAANKDKGIEAIEEAIILLHKEANSIKDEDMTDDKKNEIIGKYTTTGYAYNEEKAKADDTKTLYAFLFNKDTLAYDKMSTDSGKKIGDMIVIENKASNGDLSYTVYTIKKTQYIDDYKSVNVRHILVSVDEGLTGLKLTEAQAEARKEAEKYLNEYKAGEMTAEKFGELAKKYTDDGNGDKGGLYENVTKGQMVTEFEDWIYNADRKVGDTDIVQTKYGQHVMYYDGEGVPAWKVDAKEGIQGEKYTELKEELIEKYSIEYSYKTIVKIP